MSLEDTADEVVTEQADAAEVTEPVPNEPELAPEGADAPKEDEPQIVKEAEEESEVAEEVAEALEEAETAPVVVESESPAGASSVVTDGEPSETQADEPVMPLVVEAAMVVSQSVDARVLADKYLALRQQRDSSVTLISLKGDLVIIAGNLSAAQKIADFGGPDRLPLSKDDILDATTRAGKLVPNLVRHVVATDKGVRKGKTAGEAVDPAEVALPESVATPEEEGGDQGAP
jgi:hypothetical protein